MPSRQLRVLVMNRGELGRWGMLTDRHRIERRLSEIGGFFRLHRRRGRRRLHRLHQSRVDVLVVDLGPLLIVMLVLLPQEGAEEAQTLAGHRTALGTIVAARLLLLRSGALLAVGMQRLAARDIVWLGRASPQLAALPGRIHLDGRRVSDVRGGRIGSGRCYGRRWLDYSPCEHARVWIERLS